MRPVIVSWACQATSTADNEPLSGVMSLSKVIAEE